MTEQGTSSAKVVVAATAQRADDRIARGNVGLPLTDVGWQEMAAEPSTDAFDAGGRCKTPDQPGKHSLWHP
jgi:hypothetical protein